MTKKTLLTGLTLITLLFITQAATADRQGWYGGLDLGIAFPEDIDTSTSDTDVPTNCDQHLGQSTVGGSSVPLPLSHPSCARGQDSWTGDFDMDDGVLLGLNIGYAWGHFRVEAEYFHRNHNGDTSPLQLQTGGKDDEFAKAEESIRDFEADHLFANFYYDFYNTAMPMNIIPYVGAGLGWMHAEMKYSSFFLRNADRGVIQSIGRNPNAAGTLTSVNDSLSDTLFGYQIMTGFDYELQKGLYLGVKARYVDFGSDELKDSGQWDMLRGHTATIEPGGDAVVYTTETDDLSFWGLSANLKYFF